MFNDQFLEREQIFSFFEFKSLLLITWNNTFLLFFLFQCLSETDNWRVYKYLLTMVVAMETNRCYIVFLYYLNT